MNCLNERNVLTIYMVTVSVFVLSRLLLWGWVGEAAAEAVMPRLPSSQILPVFLSHLVDFLVNLMDILLLVTIV